MMNEFESEDLRDLRVPELDSFIHKNCLSTCYIPGNLIVLQFKEELTEVIDLKQLGPGGDTHTHETTNWGATL